LSRTRLGNFPRGKPAVAGLGSTARLQQPICLVYQGLHLFLWRRLYRRRSPSSHLLPTPPFLFGEGIDGQDYRLGPVWPHLMDDGLPHRSQQMLVDRRAIAAVLDLHFKSAENGQHPAPAIQWQAQPFDGCPDGAQARHPGRIVAGRLVRRFPSYWPIRRLPGAG
jgi:hypothetical protein